MSEKTTLEMITELMDREDDVTEWEWDYLNDLAEQESFTEKQHEAVWRIYQRVCS